MRWSATGGRHGCSIDGSAETSHSATRCSRLSVDLLAVCRDIAESSADPTGTQTSGFAFVQTGLPALDGITSNSVDDMLRRAPNPLVPPLGEIVAAALTPPEEAALRERFAAELGARRQDWRLATAYLSATRD